MRFRDPLDDVFRNRSHVRVLRALGQLPGGLAISAREVARRSGITHPTALSVLGELAESGLVRVHRAPRMDAYELAREHVLADPLLRLFDAEKELRDDLIALLRREVLRAVPAKEAFLFGSAVQDRMTSESDLDVAIICAQDAVEHVHAAMERVAERVRERYGNRLSWIVGTTPSKDIRRRPAASPAVWTRVVRDGVPILAASASSR